MYCQLPALSVRVKAVSTLHISRPSPDSTAVSYHLLPHLHDENTHNRYCPLSADSRVKCGGLITSANLAL